MEGAAQFPRPTCCKDTSMSFTKNLSFSSLRRSMGNNFITQLNIEKSQSPKPSFYKNKCFKKKSRNALDPLDCEGLPTKRTVMGSNLKLQYINSLRSTFRSFDKSENIMNDVMNIERKNSPHKKYSEIQNNLKIGRASCRERVSPPV